MPRSSDGSSRSAGTLLVAALIGASAPSSASADVVEPRTTSAAPGAPVPADLLPRVQALIRQGRLREARELLGPPLARQPEWAAGQAHVALTYLKEGRWETARQLLERALEIEPELHEARVPYAWCLYYLGDPAGARAGFERYLEHEPDHVDALFGLALIAFDGDDLGGAERLLRRVVIRARAERDTARQALAHARLGDVYVRNDELWRARQELQRSIDLDPRAPKARFKLSRVLRLMGEDAAAEAALNEYEALMTDRGSAEEPLELPTP